MPSQIHLGAAALLAAALVPAPASAADLFEAEPAALLRSETFSGEAFVGHLSATAREYVYAVPGDHSKVSQLDWRIDNALAVGGRLTFRPLDWLSVRARGWATVADDSSMTDYDWLAGYQGPASWTHRSIHPDTRLARAVQGDVSVAARFWDTGDTHLSVIGGYRHLNMKWKAYGGSYVYSSAAGYRALVGTFPASELGITYEQTWETPYLGLGASASIDDVTVTGEVIGSGWVNARDHDHHVVRRILFDESFAPSTMIGATLGIEYRLNPLVSLTGRAEYQRYFEAKGATRLHDIDTGITYHYPKPAAGADAETLLLSVGAKARL